MIALAQRRPASITLFAVLFFAGALIAYIDGLRDLAAHQAYFAQYAPQWPWSRDWVIVMLSARLSIALIPIAMVWLSAVRFARWMVTVMALGKIPSALPAVRALMQQGVIDLSYLAPLALSLVAVALLFTSASHRWFANRGEADPAVFA